MGMDFYIYSARNREVFKHDDWWNSEQVQEEFYARKPWNWVENCEFIPHDYENGSFIELNEKNLDELINVACHYRNYFGTFDSVPALCELRDKYFGIFNDDEDETIKDRKLFLVYDY